MAFHTDYAISYIAFRALHIFFILHTKGTPNPLYIHFIYHDNNVEYIFINAWNEWAEGAYLEPDEKYGYGYLEQINMITNNCI